MKHLYAVKDLAVQAYMAIWEVRAPGEAMRAFQDEVNKRDGKSAIAQHPEDYELYKIGEYNDQTGVIYPEDMPVLVARAKELLQPIG
ncbi:MAG: nonstructural protein [Microviridae sp.]|nr:MAG: nonstructural protein [Microviridae sp.]